MSASACARSVPGLEIWETEALFRKTSSHTFDAVAWKRLFTIIMAEATAKQKHN